MQEGLPSLLCPRPLSPCPWQLLLHPTCAAVAEGHQLWWGAQSPASFSPSCPLQNGSRTKRDAARVSPSRTGTTAAPKDLGNVVLMVLHSPVHLLPTSTSPQPICVSVYPQNRGARTSVTPWEMLAFASEEALGWEVPPLEGCPRCRLLQAPCAAALFLPASPPASWGRQRDINRARSRLSVCRQHCHHAVLSDVDAVPPAPGTDHWVLLLL